MPTGFFNSGTSTDHSVQGRTGLDEGLLQSLSSRLNELSMGDRSEIIHFGQSLSEAIEKLDTYSDECERVKEEVIASLKEIVSMANSGDKVVESANDSRLKAVTGKLDTIVGDLTETIGKLKHLMSGFGDFNSKLVKTEETINDVADIVIEISSWKRTSQEIVLGHDNAFPPWVYVENCESRGYSVEILKRLLESIGREVSFVGRPWVKVQELLNRGVIDAVFNVGWPNPALASQGLIASKPYAQFRIVLFADRREYQHLALKDLKGKRIGTIKGGVGNSLSIIKGAGGQAREYISDEECFNELNIGNVDLILAEEKVGSYISQKSFGEKYFAASVPLEIMDVVVLAQGDQDLLIEQIDQAITGRRL
jgi:ABC-type amino acid transport substrate-binding protein